MYDAASRDRRTYVLPLFDFGATATEVKPILGPKGRKGRLIDYGVIGCVEAFAGTTPATIAIGKAADADAYGEEFSLGTEVTVALGGKTVRNSYDPVADAAAFDALILADGALPANTSIYVTSVGGATGPTGQASPYVVIDWDL